MKYTIIGLVYFSISLGICMLWTNFANGIREESIRNRIANAYCEGKGYDQGHVDSGLAWCQKITIVQDSFDYAI